MDCSAISEIYVGTNTHAAPTAVPDKKRATYNIFASWTDILIAQDIKNGNDSISKDLFLPIAVDIAPAGNAPKIAPTGSNDPTHASSSLVSTIKGLLELRRGNTGDVHAKAVPTPMDKLQAELKIYLVILFISKGINSFISDSIENLRFFLNFQAIYFYSVLYPEN